MFTTLRTMDSDTSRTTSLLIDRERERETLERALDRLAGGNGSLLLIEGSAGIGKTSLLSEAVELARARGFLTRVARGSELERAMPFGVTRQLFESIVERSSGDQRDYLLSGSASLASIALGRGAKDPEARVDPLGPIHGLYWLVSNLSDLQPVVLAVDDAHWADTQTLRFLDYLGRRLRELPVLVVAASRTGEPDQPVELAGFRLEAEVLLPKSLSSRAVGELLANELKRHPDVEFVKACARATGGNPFLIREVLQDLRSGKIQPDRKSADTIAKLGPENVARHVLVRLRRFGEEAIRLARAIAVLGGSPQLRQVAELAGIDEGRALVLCDRLREAEILAPGVPIDFTHPLVRQSIYFEQPEGERSATHRRAAGLLASANAREIAPHLLACHPNSDQWVADRLREAAREAIAEGAQEAAVPFLERALEEPPEDQFPYLMLLGKALADVDPSRLAGVMERAAVRATEPRYCALALRYAAGAEAADGNFDKAKGNLERALNLLGGGYREEELEAESLLYFANIAHGWNPQASSRIEAVAAGVEARTPAERCVRQSLARDCLYRMCPVQEVIALARSFPPSPWDVAGQRAASPFVAAKMLAWVGAWSVAREELVAFIEAVQTSGNLTSACMAHSLLSEAERLGGRLLLAEEEARIALEIASRGVFMIFEWSARMNLLASLVARGSLTEAEQILENLPVSVGPKEIPIFGPWPIEMRGYLRLARGDLEGGVQDLLAFGEALESFGERVPLFPWRQEAAPALASLGRTAEAMELVNLGEERARAFGAQHLIGTMLRARALVEPRDRGLESLVESIEILEGSGPPHELARSLLELGAALRRAGQRSDSREPLRRSMELAHRSGATGIEERARQELVAAGSRPRTPYRTGAAALTASELRIARLAAEGVSNREIAQRLFVTRRTVETHLTHVYDKLGIQGRSELVSALDRSEAPH